MDLSGLVELIADILKQWDGERPQHKGFKSGIGPYGEPQLVHELRNRLRLRGLPTQVKRHPDLIINGEWAVEFKIVRPYGDNGKPAEDWSVNLLHPYPGSTSAVGDALMLKGMKYPKKAVFVIGYEHDPANPQRVNLDTLFDAFELIARDLAHLPVSKRSEQTRDKLVHPVHQVVRCAAWQIFDK
ncbi:hypothetical protein HY642_05940 [Candidatus Woesearchaeota archaeon]|nr:hypothetical protein [Candidatus Woesearchaeota archaeon]